MISGKYLIIPLLLISVCSQTATCQPEIDLEGDIVEWAGTGPNAAFVTIDFDSAENQSAEFVFGVNFTSDTITGEDALRILNTESSLEITSTSFSFGLLVDAFSYTYQGIIYAATGEFPIIWSYWTSEDSGQSYEIASVGVSDRILSNGDVDGWTFGEFAEAQPNGPRLTPPSPIPTEADVVEWAGTGHRAAYVVIDFDESSTSSAELVFGVNFSEPAITGERALQILNTETALEVTSTSFSFGLLVDAFTYTHNGRTYSKTGEFPIAWSYWLSRDFGLNYDFSSVGARDRILHHGDTDSWVFGEFGVTSANGPRTTPPAPDQLAEDAILWIGNGPRTAFVVVDFNEASTQSAEFVFGLRFSEQSISGIEALNRIAAKTALEIESTDFSFGTIVDSIQYMHDGTAWSGSGEFPIVWSYWISRNFGDKWNISESGSSSRRLHHGDTDGWAFGNFGSAPPNGPRFLLNPTAAAKWNLYY